MTNMPEAIISEADSTQGIWGIELYALGCQHCKQVFLVQKDGQKEQRCPYCAQKILTPQSVRLHLEPPEAVIPFKIQQTELTSPLEQFTSKVWLRPEDFTTENLIERITPVFLPMWLVDCEIHGNWEAEAGFDYEVKSSKESYQNDTWISTPVIEKRARWEKRIGEINRKYNNIIVPAISHYPEIIEKIGKFDLSVARPYHFQIIKNIFLNVPDQPPDAAWPIAKSNFNHAAEQDCQKASAAQHIRNFFIRSEYKSQHWTQLLMPMYFTHYTDDEGIQYPVYIHGQTGRIEGLRMASSKRGWRWAGLAIAMAVALFLASLLFFAFNTVIPGLFIAGMIFAILAFGSGVFSLVPMIWPWQWNRKQRERHIYHKIPSE